MGAGFAAGAALGKLAKAGKTYAQDMKQSSSKSSSGSSAGEGPGKSVSGTARKVGTKIRTLMGKSKQKGEPSKGTSIKSLTKDM